MRLVLDIEANSLTRPTAIHLIVCKDIDTGELHVYRNVNTDEASQKSFLDLSKRATLLVGHNILGYDLPVLCDLLSDFTYSVDHVIDTLIVSRLVDYSREGGHSIEQYGTEFGLPKIHFNDWTKWSQEMEGYCIRDVEINLHIYNNFYGNVSDPSWSSAINLEQRFQLVVNSLHYNGFAFNTGNAKSLLQRVETELETLDKEFKDAYPPRLKCVREIEPRYTKHGTLNRNDFRWVQDNDLSEFNGGPFCLCRWQEFNPNSHKQIVDLLHEAGWKPVDKTKALIEAERNKSIDNPEILKYGWRVNENNLATLPSTAPSPARLLAKRILYESRRRTLTEWLGLVTEEGRIHGDFRGLGAWTHRMSHQRPNMANIPSEFRTDGSVQLLGKEMRSLWRAPPKKLLAGADAEGIQLRIFAHYIEDEEFTDALVRGEKAKETDPHSLNKRVLGSVCRSRQAAKRFIYALLLGAGTGKLAEILDCSIPECKNALDRVLERYEGFARLRKSVIPADAKRGFFIGLDGRKVAIPGSSVSEQRHLAMSGYLQNGEAIVMKKAVLTTLERMKNGDIPGILVDVVHDEVVFEVPNSLRKAQQVIDCFNQSIEDVGVELKLKCPLKGTGSIGLNWWEIH